jgi:hypothetical protein
MYEVHNQAHRYNRTPTPPSNVVSYTVGCFDIQFITRIYKGRDLIVPRFDMTVERHFFPKMGLRVPPIALQEAKRYSFCRRSAGAHERTCAQEDGTVRHQPVIPGTSKIYLGEGSLKRRTKKRTKTPTTSCHGS